MADRSQLINDYTETSTSSPKRTRPTDRQMGLGTHNLFENKSKEKKDEKPNT
jgi:hypothetical protein